VLASLTVTACPGVAEPVHLIRAGVGNSMDFHGDHFVVSECEPSGKPPTCEFADLAPGQYQVVQGPATAFMWLNALHQSTARTHLHESLNCTTECSATVTVDSAKKCGPAGTIEVWSNAPRLGEPMGSAAWSSGIPVKLDGLPCTNTIATVRSEECADDFVLLNPKGNLWIEQTVQLHPIAHVGLHVVDARSYEPIPGARILGKGLWFDELMTDMDGRVSVRTDDDGGFRLHAEGYMDRLVFLPEGATGSKLIPLLPGRAVDVFCHAGDSPCPSTTLIEASAGWTDDYDGAPEPCTWTGIGTWTCTATDNAEVRARLDGTGTTAEVPPSATTVDLILKPPPDTICLDFDQPGGRCDAYVATYKDGLPHTKVFDGVVPGEDIFVDADAGAPIPVLVICSDGYVSGRGVAVAGHAHACGHIALEELASACLSQPARDVACRLTDEETPQGPSYEVTDCTDVHSSTYRVDCGGAPAPSVSIAPGQDIALP